MAIFSTLAFIVYNKGAGSGPLTSSSLDSNIAAYEKSESYDNNEESSSLQDFSVFQWWHDQQPTRPPLTVAQICQQFQGPSVQRACLQRLHTARGYCSKRQSEEEVMKPVDGWEDGGDGDGGGGHVMNDSVVDVFSYRRGNKMAMYCSVHKVASTFWLRLFRFLNNDTGSPVSSPEALSKFKVHLAPFQSSRPLALAYLTRMLGPDDEEFRFMFTRDPYRRLWSVYIDKFVLPDFFFWSLHARAIKEYNYPDKERGKPFSNCLDVSFEEFVRYTVQAPSSPSAPSDDHLVPVFKTCNPCVFQPHFIGSLENMTQDSQAVLDRLGLTKLAQPKDFQQRVLEQIRTVTEFVYESVVKRGSLRHCLSDDELQARLIRAFILNGFLPSKLAEVRRTSVGSSVTDLLNMMKELFLLSKRSEKEVEAQKTRFFINAYDSLHWDLLYQIQGFYKEDFEAFGYDPEPAELFAQRADRKQSLAV
ncbi:hypothetical protein V1264_011048 [Littorina saxatilis]